MRFACQSCGKAYNLPEEKIAEKSNVKLKCRVCGAIVEVKRQGEIVAKVLAVGKRVGRISEAPAPLNSQGPGFDPDQGMELEDAEDLLAARASQLPSFASNPSNLSSPLAMPMPPAPAAALLESRAQSGADSPLPAWSSSDDDGESAASAIEERPRLPVPLSPPPVHARPSGDASLNGGEYANGQGSLALASEPIARPAAEVVAPPPVPIFAKAALAAPPPAPLEAPAVEEKGGDGRWRMVAAFITGILLGLILARLIQYR